MSNHTRSNGWPPSHENITDCTCDFFCCWVRTPHSSHNLYFCLFSLGFAYLFVEPVFTCTHSMLAKLQNDRHMNITHVEILLITPRRYIVLMSIDQQLRLAMPNERMVFVARFCCFQMILHSSNRRPAPYTHSYVLVREI